MAPSCLTWILSYKYWTFGKGRTTVQDKMALVRGVLKATCDIFHQYVI